MRSRRNGRTPERFARDYAAHVGLPSFAVATSLSCMSAISTPPISVQQAVTAAGSRASSVGIARGWLSIEQSAGGTPSARLRMAGRASHAMGRRYELQAEA
jgi:hypothetical protein